MLKIENVVLPSDDQWFAIIRGMRNPKNSWSRSDSHAVINGEFFTPFGNIGPSNEDDGFYLGEENDLPLAMALASGGPIHGKFRRMIPVYLDITAPLYWWKEFDTYKVGTVANSCSTMHKIADKKFEMSDFSTEHLAPASYKCLGFTVKTLNDFRDCYISYDKMKNGDIPVAEEIKPILNKSSKKDIWWQMVQLLPSSYNQKRTIMLNYEVLSNIYQYRRNHKLDEWHTLCDWIKTLPYSELIFANMDLDEEDEGK